MMYNYNHFLTIVSLFIKILNQQIHKFPLTYAFTPDFQHKFPIKISFNQTQTFLPFQSDQLYLFNLNISMEIHKLQSPYQNTSVIIGLKQPSTFLISIQSFFKVPPYQIQFGKQQFLQLLINDNSFVQTADYFIDKTQYSIQVLYNYGKTLSVQGQNCRIIDSDLIYFDQIFIRQMLNFMDKKNKIQYTFDQQRKLVNVDGDIKNFPKLTLKRENSLFQLFIKNKKILYYIQREQNDSKGLNIIGYHSMKQFSKFEIEHENIIFKRTSQFYQLYLFLGYFVGFVIITIFFQKKNLFDSMKFVKNLIKWVIFQNQQSRIQVLRTQLE